MRDCFRVADLFAKVPHDLWQAKLGLALLRQRAKGEKSAFEPYIELLPSAHSGIPMFFNGEALDRLQYPPVTEQVYFFRSCVESGPWQKQQRHALVCKAERLKCMLMCYLVRSELSRWSLFVLVSGQKTMQIPA